MAVTPSRAPRPFTPSQEAPADLRRRTVGRSKLLKTIAERLTTAATSRSLPHTLLVGPRGSGKTHLLHVAMHLLSESQPEVGSQLAVAMIPEDAIGITRYSDLLWEIGAALGIEFSSRDRTATLESQILEAIPDRKLLLVMENLDRVFRALGVPGQQDLRSWVETSGRVMILAATPALFPAIRDRSKPWFGGLIVTPVDGLSADEGRELLTILARDAGAEELVEFLQSDRGRSRVEAIAELTGGSPRIWMVLAECITIQTLDALVPAVEQLVESLVPYYQQLLWDLPDNQQAIVRQLAEGDDAALTASEIANATRLSQQTVSKALQLLEEGRWVRSDKISTDRRRSFYSLREPMLRHHFQWRGASGQPLRLIVDLLKAWHDPQVLRRRLSLAELGSPAESYLGHSLRSNFHDAYAHADLDFLRAEARRWIHGHDDVYTHDCGRYVEACLALHLDPQADIQELLAHREPEGTDDEAVVATLTSAAESPLEVLLCRAAEVTSGDTMAGLTLVAAGWMGQKDAAAAHSLLTGVREPTVTSRATWFAVQLERILFEHHDDHAPKRALEALNELLGSLQNEIGASHTVTLTTRHSLAHLQAELGLIDEAVGNLLPANDATALLAAVNASPEPPSAPRILRTLWLARHGDEEALIRLPRELARIARDTSA